ncbi:MAG: MFS transporter [Pseudomonadota bacterium]
MTTEGISTPSPSAPICAARARGYLLVAAILASALGYIDGSIVAIAMPAMRADLGAGLVGAQWIANGYMLSLAALTLVGGAMADRFGLVRVFGLGLVGFMVTSLLCAIAPTTETLIGARVFQGIAAALVVPGSLALITAAYPPEERGRAIGTWAAASAITTALGPILGGILLSVGGDGAWRIIFAVNLPLGAVALWLLWRFSSAETPKAALTLDWPGAVTASAGFALIAWALTGAEHGGDAPTGAGAAAVAGGALLALFLWIETRSRNPMLPLSLFRSPQFAAANALTFTLYFALSAMLFFLPMATVGGWGLSELMVSLSFLPLTIAITVMSRPVGAWADRVGPGRPIILGCALVAVAYGLIALTAPLQAFLLATLPALTLAGIGMGLVVAPLSTAVMSSAAADTGGIASGVNNAMARLAGLVAVAAMGGVAASAYGQAGGVDGFGIRPVEPADLHALASGAGLAAVAWVTACLAAVSAIIAAWGLKWTAPPKDRPS